MPTFDVVSEVDLQEVRNAVDQAAREVATRFDFKDTGSTIELGDVEIRLHTSTEDRLIAPEVSAEMAGLIPQGRLETIEGVGHLSNLEAPGAFDAALLEHLAASGLR